MSNKSWDIWNMRETKFPKTGTPNEQLQFLLNYAVLAPSSHNTQPWLFKIKDKAIDFYADRTRILPVADPQGRELIISCGTALFNLRIALHHFGYKGKITTFPDPSNPDFLARIQFGCPIQEDADEHLLFKAIQRRHTNRKDYEDWDVPQSLLKWLQTDAEQEGAWLYIVKQDTARNAVAELVTQGDHLLMADPNYRRELSAWIRPGNSTSHDGIPGYAQGIDEHFDFVTPILALVLRTFDMGDSIAERSRKLVEHSPVIAVLGTKGDTQADWLAAGQALERLLLRGQAVGLSASFLNQPIQVPSLRSQLSQILHEPGYPQILLRLGFGVEVKQTPRRAIDEVLF
ncbi:MAG: nitroreductase [Scytonema sp. RU_4_4]|nr:nitroreductase [Scytonema sp. RU_4_4]NJR75247.1 nitroreductase [Scytonema sp. CRU_2_7]